MIDFGAFLHSRKTLQSRLKVLFESPVVERLRSLDSYPKIRSSSGWQAGQPTKWGRRYLLVALCLLGIVGYMQGSKLYSIHEDSAEFYRHYFAPAINFTCTGRMEHYVLDPDSQKFLNDEIEVFTSCDAVAAAEASGMWVPFDKQSVYLYFVTSMIWKVFGMSWDSLAVWAGLLVGLFAISGFVFLRVFSTSTLLAAIASGLFLFADINVKYIPEIRDFSKAPFLLLALGLIGLAVSRNFSRRTVIFVYAAAGLCVAFGQGFRPDIAVVVPIAIVSSLLLLLRPDGPQSWKLPLLALAAFGVTYVIGTAPISILAAQYTPVGSHSPHFFNLGYAETFFENNLRMASPNYEQFRFYHDSLAAEHTNAFAGDPDGKRHLFGSPQYDKDGWANFFDVTATFPHDAFMRPFYALRALMYRLPEVWYTSGLFGLLLLTAGLIMNTRATLYLVAAAGALITISTLQFDERHFFHLIILFVALGMLGLTSLAAFGVDLALGRPLHLDRAPLVTAAVIVAAFLIGCFALDRILHSAQVKQIDRLVAEYEDRHWRPMDFRRTVDQIQLGQTDAQSGLELLKVTVKTDDLGRDWSILSQLHSIQPDALSSDGGATVITLGSEHGYQAITPPITYTVPPEGEEHRMVKIFVDITVDADQIVLGALTGDQQQWLANTAVINRGSFYGFLQFPLPDDYSDFVLVIEKPGPETGKLTIRIFDVLPSHNICRPSEFQIGQIYDGAPGMAFNGAPEGFDLAKTTEYYFPALFLPSLHLSGLTVSGTPAACIEAIEWSPIDKGDSKAELIIVDGNYQGPGMRGSFSQILPLIFFGDQKEREMEAWRRESERVRKETVRAQKATEAAR